MRTKIALGYARSSGQINPKESIPTQELIIKQYCEKNEIHLRHIYVDECKTGTKVAGRNQYRSLKEEVLKDKNIDMVIVAYTDRLSRDSYEIILTMEELKDIDVEIYSVSENLSNKKMSPIQMIMVAVQAEMENKQRQQRIYNSVLNKFHEGMYLFGKPPFGYTLNEEKLLILDKERAEIVRNIYHDYLSGIPIPKIAQKLNDNHNIKNANFVRSILKNKTYTGYIYKKINKSNKEMVEDFEQLSFKPHKSIISIETFEKVQKEINKVRKKSSKNGFHLLSRGVSLCSECNQPIISKKQKYYCRNKCVKVSKELMDQKVIDLLKHRDIESGNITMKQLENKNYEKLLNERKLLDEKFARAEITIDKFKEKVHKLEMKLKLLGTQIKSVNGLTYTELIDDKRLDLLKNKIKEDGFTFILRPDHTIIFKK